MQSPTSLPSAGQMRTSSGITISCLIRYRFDGTVGGTIITEIAEHPQSYLARALWGSYHHVYIKLATVTNVMEVSAAVRYSANDINV